MFRPGGLTFASGLIVAFLCACLLIASASALGAGGPAQAANAKAKRAKACKKKHRKARRAAKKAAACKKRGPDASSPGPRTVTLTWDSSADIDLQVYDQSGHRSGQLGGGMVDGIPGATHSANDTDGFGPETFDDPAGRRVGYLVCWVSGPHANVTLTDSGNGGGTYTAGLGPTETPPTEAYSTSVGWGYLPIAAHC
jgi:hypothetical protein